MQNQWNPLEESELSKLTTGDIVRIEVAVEQTPRRIEVYVNDDLIALAPYTSPDGYRYARFVIPRSQSQYTVAVKIY